MQSTLSLFQPLISLQQIWFTVKFLNIQTPEKIVVITLKFEQDGFTVE